MNLSRSCCCGGEELTCAQWCECLPSTKTITSLDIHWTYYEKKGTHTVFMIDYTIHLANVHMVYASDGQCCWMENVGGEGHGTIKIDWIAKTYVWTPSSFDTNGCVHACASATFQCSEAKCETAGAVPLDSGWVVIRCDDPCNPRPCPTTSDPPNKFTVLEIDALPTLNFSQTGLLTEYPCDSLIDTSYTQTTPVQAVFLAPLKCLDSTTFLKHACRTHRNLWWFDSGSPAPYTGCSGDPAIGWTCSGFSAPYTTNPIWGSTSLQSCPADDYNVDCHTCWDQPTPPSLVTFQCTCPTTTPLQVVTTETCTHSVVIA